MSQLSFNVQKYRKDIFEKLFLMLLIYSNKTL
jgi:hypothetical protein